MLLMGKCMLINKRVKDGAANEFGEHHRSWERPHDSASGFWIGTGNPWEALGVIGGPWESLVSCRGEQGIWSIAHVLLADTMALVRHLLKVICLPLCFEASQVW